MKLTRNIQLRARPKLSPPPAATADPPAVTGITAAAAGATVLLTPAEVAGRLGCTPKVIERWRGTGDGPRFVRLSRKTIRYRAEDVEAFVAARVVSSTAA